MCLTLIDVLSLLVYKLECKPLNIVPEGGLILLSSLHHVFGTTIFARK